MPKLATNKQSVTAGNLHSKDLIRLISISQMTLITESPRKSQLLCQIKLKLENARRSWRTDYHGECKHVGYHRLHPSSTIHLTLVLICHKYFVFVSIRDYEPSLIMRFQSCSTNYAFSSTSSSVDVVVMSFSLFFYN